MSKQKKKGEDLPVVVACYACKYLGDPHLLIIENAYPVKLNYNTFTAPSFDRVGGRPSKIQNIKETVWFCKPHFDHVVVRQKFPKPQIVNNLKKPSSNGHPDVEI